MCGFGGYCLKWNSRASLKRLFRVYCARTIYSRPTGHIGVGAGLPALGSVFLEARQVACLQEAA